MTNTGSGTRAEDLFYENLDSIPEATAELLEKYSGIARGQAQIDHVLSLRNEAYKAYPYPCLGRFRFLALDLATHPLYKSVVLPKMKDAPSGGQDSPIFIDVGTCLGQDVRKLVFDGANPQNVYGSDIVPAFIDAGYQLFKDEKRLPRDRFLCPADVFKNTPDDSLHALNDKVDILHITAVFHLFGEDLQEPVAERCLRLLRKQPGSRSLILGKQVGNIDASDVLRRDGNKRFRHNEQSWKSLWEKVVAKDEFKSVVKSLDVQVEMKATNADHTSPNDRVQKEYIGMTEQGFRWMVWSVWVGF